MLKSLNKWANDAYDFVQGACNLSGVIFAFERLTNDLREMGDLRPDHPCVVLWVDKMDDLSRSRPIPMPEDNPDFDATIVELVAVMRRLCDDKSIQGTDERNHHPDIQAVIVKLAKLSGSREPTAFGKAYDAAHELAAA